MIAIHYPLAADAQAAQPPLDPGLFETQPPGARHIIMPDE